ncbi:MAG: InlB B-repeat-containing protein [Treponema sp.]
MRKFFMVSSCIVCFAALFFVSCKNNVAVSGTPDTTVQYTVTFDLQGGTPPPPNFKLKQNVPNGSVIAEPKGEFKKDGYTFKHWSRNRSGTPKYNFKTPVKTNFKLYAIWEKNAAKQFTVTFDLQEGTAPAGFEPTQTVTENTAVKQPQGTFTKAEHIFKGWSKNQSGDPLYDFTTPVTEDITLYALWEKIPDNKWAVTLDYNDGKTQPKTELVDKDSVFSKPTPDPEREGYKFLHWQKQGETGEYSFTQNVTASLTLQAQWEKNPWKVTFLFEGGTNAAGKNEEIREVKDGQTVTAPTDITKAGHKLSHWGKNANTNSVHAFKFDTPITENLELHAVWTEVYTVTFDLDGGTLASGTLPQPQEIEKGGTVPGSLVEGLTLTKSGFVAKKWTKDGSKPFNFDKEKVKGNITLKPLWINENVTVTLRWNYSGAPSDKTYSIRRDTVFTVPAADVPQRDGYKILEWKGKKKNGDFYTTPYDLTKPVQYDLTLYAFWGKSEVTVTFDWNYEGAPAPHKEKLNSGAVVQASQAGTAPTRAGYIFDKWTKKQSGGTEYSFTEQVTDDLTLYAQWKKQHTITFDLNEGTGTAPAKQEVQDKEKAQEPDNTALGAFSRNGYYFKHWTDDTGTNTPYKFTQKVTKNTTLFAVWGKLSTVTFYANGVEAQSIPAVQSKKPGERIVKPSLAPTAAGYTFKFWSKNRSADPASTTDEFNFDTEIIAENVDVSLYAIWQPESGTTPPVKKWTVKFHLNGAPAQTNADAYKDQVVTDNSLVTAPANPVWTGYEFRHWSKASNGSEAETAYTIASTPVTGDMTLYAIWKLIPKKHTVHFDLNTGTGTKPADKQVEHGQKVSAPSAEEENAMTPPVGHHFKHWSRTQTAGSAPYTFDDEVVTAEFTLYAIWEKNDIAVTLVIYDGSDQETEKVKYGDTADVLPAYTAEHFKFLHWSDTKNGSKYTTPITAPITLYAVWEQTEWKISFNLDSGTYQGKNEKPEEWVAKNGKLQEPDKTLLKKAGHSFKHWEKEGAAGTAYNFDTPVTADMVLTAVWEPLSAEDSCTITFMHGSKEIKKITVQKNTPYSADAILGDAAIPNTIDGLPADKAFGYWTKDADWETNTKKGWLYDFRQTVTEDIILYAVIFNAKPNEVKPFLIDLDGGEINDESVKNELLKYMRAGFKKNAAINLKNIRGKEAKITKGGKPIHKWLKNVSGGQVTFHTTVSASDFSKTPKLEPKNALVLKAVYKK